MEVLNKPRRNDGWNRKIFFDQRFFEKIDTEAKAYWLGFIAADGSLDEKRFRLRIGLSAKDHTHLVCFLANVQHPGTPKIEEVGSGNGRRHFQSTVVLGSQAMCRDLVDVGIRQRKSLTATAWTGPDPLMRHYWRGVFDGDGCLHRLTSKSNSWQLHLVGSLPMCEAFRDFVKERLGYDGKVVPHGKIFRVRWSGVRKPQAVAKLLYADATVALLRKAALAAELEKVQPMRPGPKHGH